MFNSGDKVRGKYFDVPFSGTVTNRRWNEMNHRIVEYAVRLEQPMDYYGDVRPVGSTIIVAVDAVENVGPQHPEESFIAVRQ